MKKEDKKYLLYFAINFVYTKNPIANNTKIIKIIKTIFLPRFFGAKLLVKVLKSSKSFLVNILESG